MNEGGVPLPLHFCFSKKYWLLTSGNGCYPLSCVFYFKICYVFVLHAFALFCDTQLYKCQLCNSDNYPTA
jgi:hypothetical protein